MSRIAPPPHSEQRAHNLASWKIAQRGGGGGQFVASGIGMRGGVDEVNAQDVQDFGDRIVAEIEAMRKQVEEHTSAFGKSV